MGGCRCLPCRAANSRYAVANDAARRAGNTQRRLLAVDRAAIADHAIVPAGPTWNRLDHLIQAGYSKTQLAAWMGHRSIQLKRTFVTARNASRVERLYTLIQDGRLTRGDNRKVV